ncbi:hypothetical protein FA95DRAFT_1635888 [Auriscalpium vulgare]|uniref:Uncharacterized protein n=1 Tax=Auriscalpium vulgare TaxID=40419 RepID=A0ACB8RGN1_9AGAM|nr:hypothetical protein FA95DRAFT_1635888 [Auriscalpium vulgare]
MEVETCATLQREEWEVLESIFPDCVSSASGNGMKKLEIPVELGDPRPVLVTDDLSAAAAGFAREPAQPLSLSLASLPPVLLELILPATYPLYTAPFIASIHATSSWVSHSLLQQKLLAMWQPGETVLYNWVEWIRSAEFLNDIDLVSSQEGRDVITIPHSAPHLLSPLLTAHDQRSQSSKFNQTSYTCSVCFDARKGSRCLQLLCGHVFCRECLEDGWKLYIAEGDVQHVGCLDPQCVKDGREANEEEVRRVVTDEEVRRWKWLREKRILDQDPTITHCPMALCQKPVAKPPVAVGNEETGWERLRTCDSCGYCFCAFCRRTWHGSLTDCPIPVAEKFVLQYMELPEEAPEKIVLEKGYGKKNIARLVAKYREDQANRSWLDESTMACPRCGVHVEKSMGCNHMICAKCKQHFCYRCGSKLSASDPYTHFSARGHGNCYGQLFDFDRAEDEWQPMAGFEEM